MASWDTPAVASPTTKDYAAPVQDFSSLANVLQDFVKGRQMGREEDKAALFRNGIPRVGGGDTGPIDFDKTLDKAARVGGLEYAMPLLTLQQNAQNGQAGSGSIAAADSIAGGGSPAPQPAASPSPSLSPRVTAPLPAAPVQRAQPGATTQTGDATGSIMSMIPDGVSPDDTGRIASQVANEMKLDPNAAPPPELVPRIKARIANLTGRPTAQAAPVAPTEPAQTPVQRIEGGATAAPSAMDTAKADNLDKATAFLRAKAAENAQVNPRLAETLNKRADDFQAQAKAIRDAAMTASQPTPNRKDYEYAVSKGYKGTPDEWAAQAEGDKATSKGLAEADLKEQQTYIDSAKDAKTRLTTLNTLANVVSSDPNVGFGFGGDTELKVKQIAKRLGVDTGDLSGSELIKKLNASLASEMSKGLTARPTQFDFKVFLQNNPGLEISKTGNVRLIGLFQQLAQREVEIGKLARQNRDNWQNWDGIVEKYDASHPIFDPISKQQITTDSIVEPGERKAADAQQPKPQSGAPAKFSSVADVQAAISSGQLKKGDRFVGGDGVTRVVP